jgi:hypothetical protein
MQTLPKAVPESMFQFTDFARTILAGFRKPHVYCTVIRVSKSCFVRLLAGFRKPDITMKIHLSSSAAY